MAPETGIHRQYRTYEEYCQHQGSKLPLSISAGTASNSRKWPLVWTSWRHCLAGANVLPRRPRQRMRSHRARLLRCGVDLNPGPGNKTVLPGTHSLQFADSAVDVVYANALDHVFGFDRAVGETKRVLKPNTHLRQALRCADAVLEISWQADWYGIS